MTNANEVDFETRRWIWGRDIVEPRLLHVALRTTDIDRSLHFYVDGLGMKLMDRISIGPNRATVAFVGFGDDYRAGGFIELAHYADHEGPYTHGTGFHHISIGVPDIHATVARLEAMGTEVTVRPTMYLDKGPWIAYVKDPDGYPVEFLQTVMDHS